MNISVTKNISSPYFYRESFLIFEPIGAKKNAKMRSWSKQAENFQILAAKKNEMMCLEMLGGKGTVTLAHDQVNEYGLQYESMYSNWLADLDISKLTIEEKLSITRAIIAALTTIHAQNIFHFSLRPSSFLLDDTLCKAQIVDFGSARVCPRGSSGIGAFYPFYGDARFLAPEQSYLLDQTIDNRTDLYALGCVIFWLFTEQLPYGDLTSDDDIGYAHLSKPLNHFDKVRLPNKSLYKDNLVFFLDGLVSKEPSQRYQSAVGALKDIEMLINNPSRKLNSLNCNQRLSDRLMVPTKLYGRETETRLLLKAFDRVSKGPSEAILVAGNPGVGKSSLVGGIRESVLHSNGLYLSGKFDQYQRDMPYRAVVKALDQMVKQILSLSVDEVTEWKERINKELSPNAQVMVDILPELAKLLGPQDPLPQLGSEEQQNRFNRVFLDFIHVISTSYRPLVFFIDDLQWADMASIQLIRLLLTDVRSRYCLILGAYRDNEVNEAHPFNQMLMDLDQDEVRLHRITLTSLSQPVVNKICADTLQQPDYVVNRLSDLVYEKTQGNPFFFRQFMQELYQQDLLSFDLELRKWHWSTDDIRLQNITDNVVDLMTSKLMRLPEETKEVLEKAACIGSSIELQLMKIISGNKSHQETMERLQPALNTGLLIALAKKPKNGVAPIYAVRFLHDRVQQAAYSNAKPEVRQNTHYQIGNLLLQEMKSSCNAKEERCFEAVSHLNQVHNLLNEQQKLELIDLNLLAAKKSKSSNAYATAVHYLDQLFALSFQVTLDEQDSITTHDLPVNPEDEEQDKRIRDASIEKLECLYLSGQYDEAEAFLKKIAAISLDQEERIQLQVILITQYTRYGQLERAIKRGVEALNKLGCPIRGELEDLEKAITQAQKDLEIVPFNQLIAKEKVDNKTVMQTLDILMAMQPCCYNSGSILFPMTILKLLELTHQHGNSAYSSYVFMMYGLLCTKVLKDYQTAFEAARCSQEVSQLEERNPLLEGRLLMMRCNFIMPWQGSLMDSAEVRERAFQHCIDQGDYYWGVHAFIFGFYAELLCASSVDNLLTRVEHIIDICKEIKQPAQVYLSTLQRNLLHILQGSLDNFESLDHKKGYESEAVSFYKETNYMCGKYDRLLGRLLQGYLFGNYQSTLLVTLAEDLGQDELDEGIFHEAMYTLLNMLSILALKQSNPAAITEYYEQWFDKAWEKYQLWYQINPDSFSAGYYLVKAEMAAIRNDEVEAFNAFEKSIFISAKAGFALYQAIANERSGLYRLRLQQVAMANAYIEQAKTLYAKWGAFTKSHELDTILKDSDYISLGPAVQHFNWPSVISASQEISQPLVLTELINRMLLNAAALTGAQNVAFYQINEGRWHKAAMCYKGHIQAEFEPYDLAPESILFYTLNSRKILTIKDAKQEQEHLFDKYIVKNRVCSVLCLPLFVHDNLVGILYLEHLESSNLFTAQRVQIMELLAGQFAISYQNASYFQQLEDQNEALEVAVDQRTTELNRKNKHLEVILQALPIPFGITKFDGSLMQANEQLFECLELSPEELFNVNASQFYVDQEDRKRMFVQLRDGDGVTDFECEMKTFLGRPFWATLSVSEIALDFGAGLFVTIKDISDRKEKEKRLRHQAFTDPLTGAQNRRAFKRNAEVLRNLDISKPLFVAMLDIDNFKRLNDTYGHTAGDIVLRQFTEYVQSHLRDRDILGRLGGEEFGLTLSNIQANEADRVVQRIVSLVENMVVMYENQKIQFTVSIGLTQWNTHESLKTALNRADGLLYEAKERGRNRVITDCKKD